MQGKGTREGSREGRMGERMRGKGRVGRGKENHDPLAGRRQLRGDGGAQKRLSKSGQVLVPTGKRGGEGENEVGRRR